MKSILMIGVLVSAAWAHAAVHTLKNDQLTVRYDTKTSSYSVQSVQNPKLGLKGGQFAETGGTVEKGAATHPDWGQGSALVITHQSGSSDRIVLYPALSFAVIQHIQKNASTQVETFQKIPTGGFAVEINGKRADELAVRSSGALSKPSSTEIGSYVFAAVADPATRNGMVCGWLTHDRGDGIVFVATEQDRVQVRSQIDYGALRIATGGEEQLESFMVGLFDDARVGLEQLAGRIAEQYDIELKDKPSLYCTWYNTFRATNEKNLFKTVDLIQEKQLPGYGLSVVQIDDGWQAGIEKGGPARDFYHVNESYASGMKATADKIKSADMVAGIWFKPFSGTASDPWFADKQELFATMDGQPYNARWGGDCLDMTNPKAQDYMSELARLISKDWGYKYFKLDGMWCGTATQQKYINTFYVDDKIGESKLFNPDMTHIEAFRTGLKKLRKAAGDEVFILGCNTCQNMRSLGGSFGLVNAMRIGPDNRASYPATLKGPLFGGRFYFLHNRVWHNDPDPAYVRESLPLNDARSLCSWVALTGTLTANSVDYSKLPAERLDLLRRTIPSHSLNARPVDFFDYDSPTVWMLEDPKSDRKLVGLFNWGKSESDVLKEIQRAKDDDIEIQGKSKKKGKKKPKKKGDEWAMTAPIDPAFSQNLDWVGLDESKQYVGFEYWSNSFIDPFSKTLERTVPSRTCQVISLVEVKDEPQVIGTSRHITQGVMDLLSTEWSAGEKSLSGRSLVVGSDPYEIRVAARKSGGAWTCTKAVVSKKDRRAGVKIKMVEQDGWKLRVQIDAPENREVQWKLLFK
ncbi:Alpha-galactosidase [Pontiella sulfatireligans]|uniref:Alpha-galactosidase n=2 Tax=Pontiella sulfatireligans TaxID=2750658 RepID=A0A6C2UGV3_9BACT|nr:Alpha-galactosidase [Pontiella sulfatireligans]